MLTLLLSVAGVASAADLVVDGTTQTLDGTQSYGVVQVINGGVLQVTPYDGTGTTGTLHLVADSIEVDSTSSIVADGGGYRGQHNASGEGPGGGAGGSCCADSGGGGGHGSAGGTGSRDGCSSSDGSGGAAYGDPSSLDIDMGSAGGAAGTADGDDGGYGADGGGAIWLEAEEITLAGTLSADGTAGGVTNNDAEGGGAGGGLLLHAATLTCTGTLRARGGAGGSVDDGGGGGGGGVIKQFYDVSGTTCGVDVSGGAGGCGATAGGTGSDSSGEVDWDGDGVTSADGDCDPLDPAVTTTSTWYLDSDGDGFGDPSSSPTGSCTAPSGYVAESTDCDDTDVSVNPDAEELCDGVDNDCDGTTDGADATDATTWYEDADGDGYGNLDVTEIACDQPSGFASNDYDCDDTDGAVNRDAVEVCDGVDNDCDGQVDPDDSADAASWYDDADGDGFGDASGSATISCTGPSGTVDDNSDCDDSVFDVNPDATELCDGVDNDCDGVTDPDDSSDADTWYADDDGDGYGDGDDATTSCSTPSDHVANSLDCDDSDFGVNPDATEVCDGVDNDCDGDVDPDDAEGAVSWYRDDDGDGFGDAGTTVLACDEPSGYTADDTDCDDTDGAVNPDATEVCDGIDNDCDGVTDPDDAGDASTWYGDGDGDGFGDAASSTQACEVPSGHVSDDQDCDDGDFDVNPDATEVCDGVDNDCDGVTDPDDSADASTWYADSDGDGYGDAGTTTTACEAPTGYGSDTSDCDDSTSAVSPEATEVCNGIDDDCDGDVDPDTSADASTWYTDSDGDGFGDAASSTQACEAPSGTVSDATDCDDSDATASPGQAEVCDGVDNDCDTEVDEDSALDAGTWHADDDGDGFGDAYDASVSCEAASGTVANATDCDDTDGAVNPDATEVCDGVDNDCDGVTDPDDSADATTWYTDGDGDGHGDAASSVVACEAPSGTVADSDDCDDTTADASPDNTEVCDGIDNDCDTEVDEEDADDVATWYADDDGDGYGDPDAATESCEGPSGHVANDLDCDDAASDVNPAATEVCDGVDNNCDGETDEDAASDASTWYDDDDGDGFGDPGATSVACEAPSGTVGNGDDCHDGAAAVNPDATEVCDLVDNDCDDEIDEDTASDVSTWYADDDEDGYGDPDVTDVDCDQPSGMVGDDTDCDDTDPTVNPGRTESWYDGTDQDCDGNDDDQDEDGHAWEGVDGGDDCDDADADVHPGAEDTWYDGVDSDCDGASDYDADGDGHDSASYDGDDCDDADPDTYPGAPDEPGDGIVTDCDASDEYDADGDGYDLDVDCDDNNSEVNPGAEEIWYDGVDQDCDDNDDDQDEDGWPVDLDCDDEDPEAWPGAGGYDADCEPIDSADTADSGVDAGETGWPDTGVADTGTGDDKGGCSCTSASPGASWGWLLAVLLGVVRRRDPTPG